jgi:hypothetical protein
MVWFSLRMGRGMSRTGVQKQACEYRIWWMRMKAPHLRKEKVE